MVRMPKGWSTTRRARACGGKRRRSGPKRGRLVFPAFVFAGPHYYPTQESTVLYYSDDAMRFQLSASKFIHARPEDQFDEPAIVERADGSILLSIRSNYSLKDKATHNQWPFRLQAVSTDQGKSFGSFTYATDLPDPSCPHVVYGLLLGTYIPSRRSQDYGSSNKLPQIMPTQPLI